MLQSQTVIHSDPEVLGSMPAFRDTRVPIQSLVDYPEGGDTLAIFLKEFPPVARAPVLVLLTA